MIIEYSYSPAEYYVDKINHMEGILEDIWGLLYENKQSYEYYGQIYAHLMVEMQIRKAICDILIPYYMTGLMPDHKIAELDKAIETYKRCNKNR